MNLSSVKIMTALLILQINKIGIGGVNRKVVFGTACQLPDGRWVEKDVLKQIQR